MEQNNLQDENLRNRYKIKWASKIRPELLGRLYASSAEGLIDEDLLDDVGIRLYLRCESIVMISRKELFCPSCGRKISFSDNSDQAGQAECPACGYACTLEQYRKSYQHRDLWQGNAGTYFLKYYQEYPGYKTPGQKIIAIDTLIHSFHIDSKQNLPNRAAANNLIEGSLKHVVAFLDKLSGISPANDEVFRRTANEMWKRRKGDE